MAVKYLLTGAAGDLGSNVVKELQKKNADMRALVLPGDKAATRLPDCVERIEGDVLDIPSLERFFDTDGELIVIHMAGVVTTCSRFVRKIYDINVNGTANIVEQCLKHGVKKLVYISSVHALPELKDGETITENTCFEPDKIVGFYGKTKSAASRIVAEAVRTRGLDASMIFPSGLCGPFDYAKGHVTQLLINSAGNKIPAGVHGGYDFVDVRDVARGVVACAEKGKKGEGYIMSNRYVSVEEIFRLVHEQTGSRQIKVMLPIWIARMAVPFFAIYCRIKNEKPLFTNYSLYTLTCNSKFSNEKARRELGYTVRPFEETIADAIKWLREERLLPMKKARAVG